MATPDEAYKDEIGLIDLLGVLWSGKWWILGITGAALAIAFIWLELSRPAYTSHAVVSAPEQAEYSAIYPGPLSGKAPAPDEVLRSLMHYMNSPAHQRAFLARHAKAGQDNGKASEPAREAFKVSFNKGGDLQPASIDLRYTAADPEHARAAVEGFINFSNDKVVKRLTRTVKSRVEAKVSALAEKISTQKHAHRQNLEQQIAQLEAAKERARRHNITTNQHRDSSSLLISNRVHTVSSEDDTLEGQASSFNSSILQEPLFEYGTRALAALIANRQQQLQQLPAETLQLQAQKESWGKLEINAENARALNVTQNASEAKPSRSGFLVMAAAAVLGIMFGGIVVLFRYAWRNTAD